MLVHFGTDLLQAEWSGAVVCMGTFDGVHLGHQALIHQAIALAKTANQPSIVLTFDRHPAFVLAPDRVPASISTLEQNVRLFRAHGAAVTIILPFDLGLSQMSADEFFEQILIQKIKATQMVVGHDFAFGHNRLGTSGWLSERIPTTVLDPVMDCGHRVSSSDVRAAILEGRMAEATKLLTRPFALKGVVIGGKRLGRELGYPTVNLARSGNQILPINGVYAGLCDTRFGRFKAAINVGVRPAVESGGHRLVEAFLLDYPGDSLYGEWVELFFHERLRPEEKFDTLDALKDQMKIDIDSVAHATLVAPYL
ncbi:MAG: riboflavin biosynthesis protein RibF [Fimbriimonadaceae bacterium]|jgi:riboflavin kinase/FMN adenylyltransferase|nr:riboflavin biosynthesis protein RibF [Fimbriimonadaceae bacterium]